MSNGNLAPAHTTLEKTIQWGMHVITVIALAYIAAMSTKNGDKIEKVEIKQDQAADKATEVKDKLDEKIKDDEKAIGMQLYAAWRYLADVASLTESARDIAKANEARKLYEDHLKKYATKG